MTVVATVASPGSLSSLVYVELDSLMFVLVGEKIAPIAGTI